MQLWKRLFHRQGILCVPGSEIRLSEDFYREILIDVVKFYGYMNFSNTEAKGEIELKKIITAIAAVLAAAVAVFLIIKGITMFTTQRASISIIGGADGPTSVFLAGKLGSSAGTGMVLTGAFLAAIVVIILSILIRKNKKN